VQVVKRVRAHRKKNKKIPWRPHISMVPEDRKAKKGRKGGGGKKKVGGQTD